jgi:cytochrome c oxidase cbb3-type subunit 3
MKPILVISAVALAMATGLTMARGQRGGPPQSTAAQRPPQTVTPQTYSADQVRLGQTRFASRCALCHAADTFGSDTGPDLSRSRLVAEDVRGDKIGPLVRAGRVDKGMPPVDLNDTDLEAVVAFIHTQKTKMEAQGGGRRSVEVGQLTSGNAEAGQKYFTANCAQCHSPTGDLRGVGSRVIGLPLLQRMLYPGNRGNPAGLNAHYEQLGKYTDADMHNVLAYLQTLK